MSERNPPLWLEGSSHPSDAMRRLVEWFVSPGVLEGLAVTERATPSMGVTVSTGACVVGGDESTSQGAYFAETSAAVNLTIGAADASHPRKDRVVAVVADAYYSGAANEWALEVVTGTPATPALEPDLPDNALELALVDVGAGVASVLDADVTDRRVYVDGGRQQTVTFTSTGTFEKADYPWAKRYRVRVQAAGGAGGGNAATSASQVSGGGGGGAGGSSETSGRVAALDASVTVTVGAAGAGVSGDDGGAGGAASFGTVCTATGGGGGLVRVAATPPSTASGGPGGVAGTGDLAERGPAGGPGILAAAGSAEQVVGGTGGGTGGGRGGTAGGNYGGGGGGNAVHENQAAAAGSAGGPGIVTLHLYG